jgi:hypothetical protein
MKFIKDNDEERRDYILQKDEKTKGMSTFIIIILILLIIGVIASGAYFTYK